MNTTNPNTRSTRTLVRRASIFAAAASLLFAPCVSAQTPKAAHAEKKDDKAHLQGEWTVMSMEIDGELQNNVEGKKLVVTGDVWNEGGKRPLVGDEHQYKMTLNTAKTPKQLNLVINLGGNNETRRGIYKIEGETLTFCYSTGERPKEFKSDADVVLAIYKRSEKK